MSYESCGAYPSGIRKCTVRHPAAGSGGAASPIFPTTHSTVPGSLAAESSIKRRSVTPTKNNPATTGAEVRSVVQFERETGCTTE
jgi:hypothetical protein